MPFSFEGKKVLITGAGRGIGRALTLEIVKGGGDVYAIGRNKDALDALASESNRIHQVLVDLSDWNATRAALDKLGPMDCVVNNAMDPYSMPHSALECPEEILDKFFNVGLKAAVNVIQSTGQKMVEAGKGGTIVNVSSILSTHPTRGMMYYSIAKAGLDMVTKQFALELAQHNIRVNSVNPTKTITETTPQQLLDMEFLQNLKSFTPMGRFCSMEDVVRPIMYLLSEESGMVTGSLHVVDGGMSACAPTEMFL